MHEIVASTILRELGLVAELGPVQIEFPLSLVAHDIRLDHPENGLLAEAHTLVIEPSLTSLLLGRLSLKHVLIDGARVRLSIEGGQVVNLPEIDLGGPSNTDRRLPLKELVVRNAQFLVESPPLLHGSLDDVNATVRIIEGNRIQLAVSADSGRFRHALGEETLARFRMTSRITPSRIEIDSLVVNTSLANVTLKNSSAELPLDHGRYALNLDLDMDVTKLARLPMGWDLPEMKGQLAVQGHVDGVAEALRGTGHVRLDGGSLDGFGFGIMDLKIEFTPEEVRLLQDSVAFIDLDGGEVGLTGTLGLGEGLPLDVHLDVKRLGLHQLLAQLDVTPGSVAHWDLQGDIRLKGTLDPLAIEGPLSGQSKRFYVAAGPWHDPTAARVIATPPGRVRGRVRVDADSLNFEHLRAELPHSKFVVDLSIGFADTIDLHASSEQLDLRDVQHLVGMDIDGTGAFTLAVTGSIRMPDLVGTLDLSNFGLAGHPIGHMRTHARMEKEGMAVRFENTRVERGGSRYVIDDLFLDFREAFELTASARFDRLVLKDLYDSLLYDDPELHEEWQGSLHGTGKVHYTLGFAHESSNGTLTIETDARFEKAQLVGVKFSGGSLRGTLRLDDPVRAYDTAVLNLDQLFLRKGNGSLHVRGTVLEGGTINMTALAEHLPLRQTEPFQAIAPGLTGEYSIIGRVGGTLAEPRTSMDLTLTSVAFNGHLLGDARLYVRATDQRDPWVQSAKDLDPEAPTGGERCVRGRTQLARANWKTSSGTPASAFVVCGGGLDGHVELDLAVAQADGWPLRGELSLLDVPLATLFPRRRRGETPITGSLRGRVLLKDGRLDDVDSLVGDILISKVSLAQGSGWARNDGPVRIELTPGGFVVEQARFQGQGSGVTVAGSGSLKGGVAGTVRGRMDMATLSTLMPSVESSSGLLDVDVKVAGQFDDPVIQGKASLESGALKLRDLPYPLENVQAKVSFSARQLLLEEMHASVAGGRMQLRGTAALRDNELSRYELFMDGKNFSLEPMTGVRVGFSTTAKLAWSQGERLPKLSGTVRVSQFTYSRPVNLGLSEKLTDQITRTQRASVQNYDPDKDVVAFDIHVVDEAPMRINNNLVMAQLRIEDSERPFKVVGTDQRVGVLGNLVLNQGTLRFRNTEFDIESGEVTFNDDLAIDPHFDLRARTEIKRSGDLTSTNWQIQLRATGDTDNLRLDMSSEPALAQEDIALLLAVGMTRAESERLQAGDLGSSAALEALASVTGVDREVKKALPVIDDFRVSSSYSAQTNRTEPTITVGKNLSEGVRATATTGIGEDANFRTGVEWRLNNQTSVEAAYDNRSTASSSTFGNVGVDLRWRLEFD